MMHSRQPVEMQACLDCSNCKASLSTSNCKKSESVCHFDAVIPPFHSAVDKAISYLDPVDGLLGVADFFVSGKHDLPLRQMHPARRFFWRYRNRLHQSYCQLTSLS